VTVTSEQKNGKADVAASAEKILQIKLLWRDSPIEIKYYDKPQSVTVGSTKTCDFWLNPDGLPVPEFPIIRMMNGDYVLTYTDAMAGDVDKGGETVSFESLSGTGKATKDPSLNKSFQYKLSEEMIVSLPVGSCTLQMEFVPPKEKLPFWTLKKADLNWVNALLIALFASMTLLVSLFLFPFDLKSATEDITKNPNKFVNFIMTPAKKVEDPYLEKLKKQPKEGESGAKAALKEGKMGKKEAPDVFKRSAVKAIKLDDREIVSKSGLLKIFGKGGGIFQGSGQIFGGKGLGGDLQNALGGLFGTTIGDARGSGGLGLKGSGPGGGGDSLYSVGIGTVGTRGRGAGEGGYGYGVGSIGGKKDHDIGISGGTPLVLGSLDKELIRRVIHAHRNEIRYCYERALTANPGLWGKVTVNFIIGANGMVQSSKTKETSLNNVEVENCISQKIKMWKFPEPKGGGIVVVTYPFVLKQTD
jgi:hypothetical protein